jgi:hypothetical protein
LALYTSFNMQHSAIFKLKIKQQALRKLLTFSYVSTSSLHQSQQNATFWKSQLFISSLLVTAAAEQKKNFHCFFSKDVKKTGYKADPRVTDGMDLRNQLRLVPTEVAKMQKVSQMYGLSILCYSQYINEISI